MSVPANIQQLIVELLQRTSRSEVVDNETVLQVWQKLTRLKFTSTDEFSIDARWDRLCEKFSIKGHDRLARQLGRAKERLLNPASGISEGTAREQRILKYDMMAFLLAMSCRPLSQMDTVLQLQEHVPYPEEGDAFWKNVMQEEPLEGDHWAHIVEDDDDEAESASDAEVDQEALRRHHRRRSRYLWGKQLLWDDVYAEELLDDDVMEELELLKRYWEEPTAESRYINEEDMMREVLFLFTGACGALFYKDPDAVYSPFRANLRTRSLRHASQPALSDLLEGFCKDSNIVHNLRQWTSRTLQESPLKNGQTCQAFAQATANLLVDFERSIGSIMVDLLKDEEQGSCIASLLRLRHTVDQPLKCLKAIHGILQDLEFIGTSANNESRPRTLTAQLLTKLCDAISMAQTTGKTDLFKALLRVYEHTIQPYGRLVDDWVFLGTLEGDIAQEFCISRNPHIGEKDSLFWEQGFTVHTIQGSDCPLFSESFIKPLFFTGKANAMLYQFDMEPNTMVSEASFREYQRVYLFAPHHLQSNNNHRRRHSVPDRRRKRAKNIYQQTIFPLHYQRQQEQVHEMNSASSEMPIEQQHHHHDGWRSTQFFTHALSESLAAFIDQPYKELTRKLYHVLQNVCSFFSCLRVMTSVYLMLENDLAHVFCELLFPEIEQGIYPRISHEVEKILEKANQATTITTDLDRVSVTLVPADSVLDSIQFEYSIPWPINNFIQSSSLVVYQKVNSLLLRLKWAKYVLERKMLFERAKNPRLYLMRVRLLWFVNSIWGYIMTTVLHSETLKFRAELTETTDADSIVALHQAYISRIRDRCLLNEKTNSIRKAVYRILAMVDEFYAKDEDGISSLEKEFERTNQFIATSLKIVAEKGGLPWLEVLAGSLSAQASYK